MRWGCRSPSLVFIEQSTTTKKYFLLCLTYCWVGSRQESCSIGANFTYHHTCLRLPPSAHLLGNRSPVHSTTSNHRNEQRQQKKKKRQLLSKVDYPVPFPPLQLIPTQSSSRNALFPFPFAQYLLRPVSTFPCLLLLLPPRPTFYHHRPTNRSPLPPDTISRTTTTTTTTTVT